MTPAEIRAFRAALGLSGADFARMVGAADARNVRRWESGDNTIPGSTQQFIRLLMWLKPLARKRAIKTLMGSA